jgi:hypothetical protein
MSTNYLKEFVLVAASIGTGLGAIAIYNKIAAPQSIASTQVALPAPVPNHASRMKGDVEPSERLTPPVQKGTSESELRAKELDTQLAIANARIAESNAALEKLRQESERLMKRQSSSVGKESHSNAVTLRGQVSKEKAKSEESKTQAKRPEDSSERNQLIESMQLFSEKDANPMWPSEGIQLMSRALKIRASKGNGEDIDRKLDAKLDLLVSNGLNFIRRQDKTQSTRECQEVARNLLRASSFLSKRQESELKSIAHKASTPSQQSAAKIPAQSANEGL